MDSNIRILISYVTAGAGHQRAAEAIAEAVRLRLPSARVTCLDLLDDCPALVRWAYPRLYQWIVRVAPGVWGAAYRLLDEGILHRAYQGWRRRWNLLIARRFARRLERERPDVVVATHFFPADVAGACKAAGRFTGRLITVVTDLTPHRLWLAPEADVVVVGSDRTRELCRRRGVPEDRLHVLGIPISLRFRVPVSREEAARRIGLDPSRITVLVASGGMGVGPIEDVVRGLLGEPSARTDRMQLIVVCGRNRALAHRLAARRASAPMPMQVYGFIETMPQLMQASDVLVTKAGGVTMMEALAMGLPMVLYGNIPGQEELNAQHVASHGAGIIARTVRDAQQAIGRLCDDPAALSQMRRQAQALACPDAAQALVEQFLTGSAHGA